MAIPAQKSFGFLAFLGQCLLIFPVEGVRSKNYSFVRFSWLSTRTAISVILTLTTGFLAVLFFNYIVHQKEKFVYSSGFVYILTVFLYEAYFIHIAKRWKYFLKQWAEVDVYMQNYPIAENYHQKMRNVAIIFMVFGVGEHIFFMCSQRIIRPNMTFGESLDIYFKYTFNYVFFVIPYHRFIGYVLQIINWLSTLVWSFADIYLIVMSIPVSFHIRQIERKLEALIHYQIKEEYQWQNVREHFNKVCEICEYTENYITHILVISFGNKLFVVIYQLLQFIIIYEQGKRYAEDSSLIQRLYFSLSFVIILSRLVIVNWFTASIDSDSEEVTKTLLSVPSDIYNEEVDRFVLCMAVSPPAFSGLKMFKVTKSLILKIATSVIVYELVVIKFQSYSKS
ncbi:gustatory receptor for sugar taste 64a-like [Sitophilus oryzae]|uniref:Gustatory receptor n=1 Tax=Sitophilus oryzae TaxID=7048 RepID=A0A6J2YCX1_SITOR|nr:gustatory receptor for sugar taste 64a-like [Sitophilus oryzae]